MPGPVSRVPAFAYAASLCGRRIPSVAGGLLLLFHADLGLEAGQLIVHRCGAAGKVLVGDVFVACLRVELSRGVGLIEHAVGLLLHALERGGATGGLGGLLGGFVDVLLRVGHGDLGVHRGC